MKLTAVLGSLLLASAVPCHCQEKSGVSLEPPFTRPAAATGADGIVLNPDALTKAGILQGAEKLLSWQLPALSDLSSYVRSPNAIARDRKGWIHATFAIGVKDWATATANETLWLWLKDYSRAEEYQLGARTYHADDHAIGQVYLALYQHYGDAAMLQPTLDTFEFILANPRNVSLDYQQPTPKADAALGYHNVCQYRWCWADALYMAPATWTALARATGDARFRAFFSQEFWAAHDYLYRGLERLGGGLLLRDSRYFTERDAAGNYTFWSRGNGWVYAGLPAIIDSLPPDHPVRARCLKLFQSMSHVLSRTQSSATGFWASSLLDPAAFAVPESSGTAFFVSGLSWGVLNGALDPAEFLPAIRLGWQALMGALLEDGRLGWVQAVGSSPDLVTREGTHLYGSGGFLQAAAGVLRLAREGAFSTA